MLLQQLQTVCFTSSNTNQTKSNKWSEKSLSLDNAFKGIYYGWKHRRYCKKMCLWLLQRSKHGEDKHDRPTMLSCFSAECLRTKRRVEDGRAWGGFRSERNVNTLWVRSVDLNSVKLLWLEQRKGSGDASKKKRIPYELECISSVGLLHWP